DFAGPNCKADVAKMPLRGKGFHGEALVTERRTAGLLIDDIAPHHVTYDFARAGFVSTPRADLPRVAHHRNPGGDGKDLAHLMADIDNRRASGAHSSQ